MSNQENPPGFISNNPAYFVPTLINPIQMNQNVADINVSVPLSWLIQFHNSRQLFASGNSHFGNIPNPQNQQLPLQNLPSATSFPYQLLPQNVANTNVTGNFRRRHSRNNRRVDVSNAIETYSPTEYDDVQIINYQNNRPVTFGNVSNSGNVQNIGNHSDEIIIIDDDETHQNPQQIQHHAATSTDPTPIEPETTVPHSGANESQEINLSDQRNLTVAPVTEYSTSKDNLEFTSTNEASYGQPEDSSVPTINATGNLVGSLDSTSLENNSNGSEAVQNIINISDSPVVTTNVTENSSQEIRNNVAPVAGNRKCDEILKSDSKSETRNAQPDKESVSITNETQSISSSEIFTDQLEVPPEPITNATGISQEHSANHVTSSNSKLTENGSNYLEVAQSSENTSNTPVVPINDVTQQTPPVAGSPTLNEYLESTSTISLTQDYAPVSIPLASANKTPERLLAEQEEVPTDSPNSSINSTKNVGSVSTDSLPSDEQSEQGYTSRVDDDATSASSSRNVPIDIIENDIGNSSQNMLMNLTQNDVTEIEISDQSLGSNSTLGTPAATSTPTSSDHKISPTNRIDDDNVRENQSNRSDEIGQNTTSGASNGSRSSGSDESSSSAVEDQSEQPSTRDASTSPIRFFEEDSETRNSNVPINNVFNDGTTTKNYNSFGNHFKSTSDIPASASSTSSNEFTTVKIPTNMIQSWKNLAIFLGISNSPQGSSSNVIEGLDNDSTSADFSEPGKMRGSSSNGDFAQQLNPIAPAIELANNEISFDLAGASNIPKKNSRNKKQKNVGSEAWMLDFVKIENKFPDAVGNVVTKVANGHMMMKMIEENGGIEQWNECFLVNNIDGLGFTVPTKQTLTMEFIIDQLGAFHKVDVIDVYKQTLSSMKIGTFAKHFTKQEHRKQLYNIISLEVSNLSSLGNLIEPPELVRKLSLVEKLWSSGKMDESRPCVQKYVLLSMKGSFTSFHIDFGGSSVYYHIVKGRKIFYLALPTPTNIEQFEKMEKSSKKSDWLPDRIPDAITRLVIEEGQTLFVPSGVIHAVYTPDDSIVVGGNFLHIGGIEMQNRVFDIESRERLKKFKFPNFIQINFWVCRDILIPFVKDANNRRENIVNTIMWKSSIDIISSLESWIKSTKRNRSQSKKNEEIINDMKLQIRTQREIMKIQNHNFTELLGTSFVMTQPTDATANPLKRSASEVHVESPEKRKRNGSE
ncbi:unnamed protein product [Caenorhabditis angaria]|uniref:JmjC domain-containing protein n=1 Tax=Caenorhabditis angaria TaxID=860376 RepID=A0A9P1NBB5_9PELO|nr:unnamed protein product [Caenorhabditis angaria]